MYARVHHLPASYYYVYFVTTTTNFTLLTRPQLMCVCVCARARVGTLFVGQLLLTTPTTRTTLGFVGITQSSRQCNPKSISVHTAGSAQRDRHSNASRVPPFTEWFPKKGSYWLPPSRLCHVPKTEVRATPSLYQYLPNLIQSEQYRGH